MGFFFCINSGKDFASAEALLEAVFSLDFGATGEGDGEEAGELQDQMMTGQGGGLSSGNSSESSSTGQWMLVSLCDNEAEKDSFTQHIPS